MLDLFKQVFLLGSTAPPKVPTARELSPDGFRMLPTNPSFLFFVLHVG